MKIQGEPNTILFPVPVALVSSRSGEKNNIITIAWAGTVCSVPPMLSISIRPQRLSHQIISESGEFVVNLPSSSLAEKVDGCGTCSGRDTDKFEKFGFTATQASKVNAPLIEECPVNIECVTKQVVSLGVHDLFIAEIVATHVSEEIATGGKIDFDKFETFAYMGGEYRTVGGQIGGYGYSVKK